MDSKSLVPMRYELLPLGNIKPQGWVKDQLQLSADGLGGHLFKFYRFVKDSTWMGGTEEYSPLRESAPYWYNYIVPLAYSLDNEDLKDQANKFLTRLLDHQHEDGWIGPETTNATRAILRFTKLAHCMLSDNFTGFIPTDGDEFDTQKFGQARAHERSTTLQWLYEQDTMDLMWKGGSKFFTEDQFPIAPSVNPAINFQHGVNLIQG
ncbi:hypothetical protein BGW36DRAFT_402145 [Talaromyces proteolyticus]|uniref:Alpha-L-rhamnosidase six-hairpin glycosidase domain-containing protein n=1 Tax=Talaromyces proteolyticus TaxID=1131652 RepID=A0AAD4PUB5_9EURO|nr:uncharacterized protein BGW36DRAFT_402145 [Talaromyces proteolyticus]KAH8689118.1 hypothetical protein BGW36DRAFT_402145 [Talaromyces proteolyticus]